MLTLQSRIVPFVVLMLFPTLLCQKVFGQSTATLSNQSTTQLYQTGTNLLRSGRHFEKAIGVLKEACRREPKNSDFKLALGCACASRANTLSRAFAEYSVYPVRCKGFAEQIQLWQAAQDDLTSPAYHTPPPPTVEKPCTQDDGLEFRLEPDVVHERIKKLSQSAWTALDEAVTLREQETPARQADAFYVRGWALMLLWQEPRRTTPGAWQGKPNEGAQEIIRSLENAARLQPENNTYLRALGDVCALAALDPRHWIDRTRRFNEKLQSEGIVHLRKVLERTPKDISLWLEVTSLECRHAFGISGPAVAISDMQSALKIAPSNAFLWYTFAGVLADCGKNEETLSVLETGNKVSDFKPIHYQIAAPKLLLWALPTKLLEQNYLMLGTMIPILNRTEDSNKNKNTDDLLRIARTLLKMEHRYAILQSDTTLAEDEHLDIHDVLTTLSLVVGEPIDFLKYSFPITTEDDELLLEMKAIQKAEEDRSKATRVWMKFKLPGSSNR